MSSLTPRIDSLERNLLINGNFDFWQRGTTFNSIATSAYSSDRWRWSKATTTSLQNVTQSIDVPTAAQSGFQSVYSLLATQTATVDASIDAADQMGLHYLLEGNDYVAIHGRAVRLQFWVKASLAGNYAISFTNNNGDRAYVSYYTVAASSTWEKKTIDLTLDNSGTWLFDNQRGLRIDWSLMTGSNRQTATVGAWHSTASLVVAPTGVTMANFVGTSGATFQLAQVMLIPQNFTTAGASNVDVLFQRAGRTIQQELAMCQRYYEKSYNQADAPGTVTTAGRTEITGRCASTTTIGVMKQLFVVTKRTAPSTVTIYNNAGGTGSMLDHTGANATVTTSADENGLRLNATGTGYTASTPGTLSGHWTADAEL